MNKIKFIGFLLMMFVLCSASSQMEVALKHRVNDSFQPGEVLNFKMSYGIFSIGKGTAAISNKYFDFNDRGCYKIDVFGETTGLLSLVTDVNDHFGSYIDTTSLLPEQFYRFIREGHYKKDEWTDFDHRNDKITVRVLDNKTGKMKDPKFYDLPSDKGVWDLIGGFLYFRTIDFGKVHKGDTITVRTFFEDEFYNLRVIYKGTDVVRIKPGKFRAIVLQPIMPPNKLFDGENSITVWFSDDKNRIPLKINAEMFIGSAGVELTDYSGLRNPVSKIGD